jgi:cytoskeletal protein RodZ
MQNTAHHLGFVPQDRTLKRISKKFRTAFYILGVLIATALIIWIFKERNTLIHSMKNVKTNSMTQMSEPSISETSIPVKSPLEHNNTHSIQMQAELSSTTSLASTPSQTTDAPLIEVSFEEPAWIEIKDAQGKMLLSQNNLPGSQQSVKGMPPYSISISQSQGVKLRYRGQAVTLPASNSNGSLNFKLE